MDQDTRPDRTPAPGRHRGTPLVTLRDSRSDRRGRELPRPSIAALAGILALVLIAAGAIHLSTRGSAIPPETGVAISDGGTSQEGAGASPPGADPGSASGAAGESSPTSPASAEGSDPTSASGIVVVHVSGQVHQPGVVELPAGSRVDDAIRAAGGAGGDADLSAVNLARPLADGEQIHIPAPGEEPRVAAEPPSSEEGTGGSTSSGSSELIDLNTASVTELEELPGVGPALAQRIVDHRESNGPFTAVEQLDEISGIGPATLEEIAPHATV